jgi:high frequency lysogenization protein
MSHSLKDQTIALAAIYQAASLAQQIAKKGMANSQPMASSIHSLFQLDPPNVVSIYGGLEGVQHGLKILSQQIDLTHKGHHEVTHYLLGLIQLELALKKNPAAMENIHKGIMDTQSRLEHFHQLHPNILAAFAKVYEDNLSGLKPRIMVKGERSYLQSPDNINKVRTFLLAGVRAAMLWRQIGGKRLQLIFFRKRYVQQAIELTNLLAKKMD